MLQQRYGDEQEQKRALRFAYSIQVGVCALCEGKLKVMERKNNVAGWECMMHDLVLL